MSGSSQADAAAFTENLRLLLGPEAPIVTSSAVDCLYFSSGSHRQWRLRIEPHDATSHCLVQAQPSKFMQTQAQIHAQCQSGNNKKATHPLSASHQPHELRCIAKQGSLLPQA